MSNSESYDGGIDVCMQLNNGLCWKGLHVKCTSWHKMSGFQSESQGGEAFETELETR